MKMSRSCLEHILPLTPDHLDPTSMATPAAAAAALLVSQYLKSKHYNNRIDSELGSFRGNCPKSFPPEGHADSLRGASHWLLHEEAPML